MQFNVSSRKGVKGSRRKLFCSFRECSVGLCGWKVVHNKEKRKDMEKAWVGDLMLRDYQGDICQPTPMGTQA
ncbi:hypothetical protein H6P81_006512 [Aristolochia fimbriata]|uniref:Uncharacterized protein n=1 Tax=Aristolochia fimbriata TaxID=158543 RepID=A0AAV7EXQ5_ARIFI|nr:hypothetical protein H6P81_006512 [Aristolochia fimbriata]